MVADSRSRYLYNACYISLFKVLRETVIRISKYLEITDIMEYDFYQCFD